MVEGLRGDGLASEPEAGFYIPHLQRPDDPTELAVGRGAVFLVRTPGLAERGAEAGRALRTALLDIDPGQPLADITPMTSLLAEDTAAERFRALLLSAFALIALVLAVTGVYGVVGQLLVERLHEFGVRRALGATAHNLLGRVAGWGMRVALPGLAFGLLGVLLLGRYLEGLLFGVAPADPLTLALAVATIATAILLACLVAAWRAVRVEAGVTLRGE